MAEKIYNYKIVLRKSIEEKDEEVDLPDNLEPPKPWIRLVEFNSAKQLWKVPKKQLKRLAKRKINQLNYGDINQSYNYNKKEEVMFWVYRSDSFDENPFGKSEVKFPEQLRKHPSKVNKSRGI